MQGQNNCGPVNAVLLLLRTSKISWHHTPGLPDILGNTFCVRKRTIALVTSYVYLQLISYVIDYFVGAFLPNYEKKFVIFVPKETGVKDPNGMTWLLGSADEIVDGLSSIYA